MVVRVELLIEPPIKWPLWFYDEVRDIESEAPISASLKEKIKNLTKQFKLTARWDSVSDSWFWSNSKLRRDFARNLKNIRRELRLELGKGYKIDISKNRYPVKRTIE